MLNSWLEEAQQTRGGREEDRGEEKEQEKEQEVAEEVEEQIERQESRDEKAKRKVPKRKQTAKKVQDEEVAVATTRSTRSRAGSAAPKAKFAQAVGKVIKSERVKLGGTPKARSSSSSAVASSRGGGGGGDVISPLASLPAPVPRSDLYYVVVQGLAVKELKRRLKGLGLSDKGRKADLVERLVEANNGTEPDEEDASATYGSSSAPAPNPVTNWSKLTVPSLRSELTKRNLDSRGLKSALVERLADDDADKARGGKRKRSKRSEPDSTSALVAASASKMAAVTSPVASATEPVSPKRQSRRSSRRPPAADAEDEPEEEGRDATQTEPKTSSRRTSKRRKISENTEAAAAAVVEANKPSRSTRSTRSKSSAAPSAASKISSAKKVAKSLKNKTANKKASETVSSIPKTGSQTTARRSQRVRKARK